MDDDSLDLSFRIGAAVWELPHDPQPGDDPGDPAADAARREVEALLDRLGRRFSRDLGDMSPAYRMLLASVTALRRLGYPCDVCHLLPYARAAERLAEADLGFVATYGSTGEQVEAAGVALTVLYEPVLLSLRLLADTEESSRRFG